jgi:steroid 5-alpha reductase family enzyme
MEFLKPILGILLILLISAGIILAGSQGSATVSRIPLFLLCASVGFILHWLVFIPSYLLQTEHYFDATGAFSYILTVTLAAYLHPFLDLRGLIICMLIAIWAARLGTFLFMRVKRAGRDTRFTEIKTQFWRFLFTWTLGGGWVFITMAAALAAITSMTQRPLGIFVILGVFLWMMGFGIEVIADRQKSQFRMQAENVDNFITTGLWSYSRHPNYFGEILLWLGITVIALPTLVGWQFVTLVSPVFVAFLLIKVSGVKQLEAQGQERWGDNPDYQHYLANTPVLVPFIGRS